MGTDQQRAILHLDMDAFFASVEQRDFPELQGKAVAVGGQSQRGVVAAASYEARKYGVHSAMPMVQAMRCCPDLIVQPGRMAVYRQVSRQVFSVFERYTDRIEKLSIDEAFLDVSGCERLFGSAREIAEAIRHEVRETLGLTISAGIAPNKFLAKLASDVNKPDGLFEITPAEIDAFLLPLPVKRLWGVGPKAADRLQAFGVHTVADLRRKSQAWLQQQFGVWGPRLYQLCRGIDTRPVEQAEGVQSVGHEETFEQDLWHLDEIHRELLSLAERVAARLRRHELQGRTLTVKVRYRNFETRTRSLTLNAPTSHSPLLYQKAKELLVKTEVGHRGLRLLGLTVSGFDLPAQTGLFDDAAPQTDNLDQTIDTLRERFGDQGLVRGSLLGRDGKDPSTRRQ